MTTQDLEARLKTLEDEISCLKDMEEIKKLQKIYGYYLERWQWEEVIGMFSDDPDTSVEINNSGVFIGKESIKRFFRRDNIPANFLHVLMQVNDVIDMDPDGKTAKGRWYGFGPHARPAGEEVVATFSCGIYENDYVKENGKWKFKKMQWSRIFYSPYDEGWVKTPVINIKSIGIEKERPKPDQPTTVYYPYPSGYLFPYHFKHPVTGK
ncbi:nuclear transport factor 2 family protein [Chloroflexota bacterium]